MTIKNDEIEDRIDNKEIEGLEHILGRPDFGDFLDEEPEIGESDVPKSNKKTASLGVGEAIAGLSVIFCKFISSKKGEHWALSQEEALELGQASEDVILEYFPNAEASPLLILGGVSLAIVAPRMMVDAKIQNELELKKQKRGSENADTTE
jgi:hypothetical protein